MIDDVISAVRQAGDILLDGYAESVRPRSKSDMHQAGIHLDTIMREILSPALAKIRPQARWIAVGGEGAFLNGRRLSASRKTELDAAIVTTTQPRTHNQGFAEDVAAVLDQALLVRASVPSTFPLLDLAAGHVDAFGQDECDLTGVAAGALLIREAGGVVTNRRGEPWRPGDEGIVAAAPGVHKELLSVLGRN